MENLIYKLKTLSSYSADDIGGDDFEVLYEAAEGQEGWASESINAVPGEAAQKLSELVTQLKSRITDEQREEIITVLQAISGGHSDDPAHDAQTLLAKMAGEHPGFGQFFAHVLVVAAQGFEGVFGNAALQRVQVGQPQQRVAALQVVV